MHPYRRVALLMVAVLLTLASLQAAEKEKNKLSDRAKSILDKAEQLELWSLDPDPKARDKDGFHNWKVLGKTVVTGEARKQLVSALEQGIAASDGVGAKCFDPRHGIRATADGKAVDLVICFECGWVYVYFDNDKQRSEVVVSTGKPQAVFDKVLTDAKVPLPKQAR